MGCTGIEEDRKTRSLTECRTYYLMHKSAGCKMWRISIFKPLIIWQYFDSKRFYAKIIAVLVFHFTQQQPVFLCSWESYQSSTCPFFASTSNWHLLQTEGGIGERISPRAWTWDHFYFHGSSTHYILLANAKTCLDKISEHRNKHPENCWNERSGWREMHVFVCTFVKFLGHQAEL